MLSDEQIDRYVRLAEAFAEWMWAQEAAKGWEQELHRVELSLDEARRASELRYAEYRMLEAELG
jgi:hypothetical protein